MLYKAASLLTKAGREDLLRVRRRESTTVTVDGREIVLKDQRPLLSANAELLDGWEFGDLVEYLNGFVFFWPGNHHDAIGPGRRLHAHYEADSPAFIRVPTRALFDANPQAMPRFCACNAGAPRMQEGRRAIRGPDLFLGADQFPKRASAVVEVGFKHSLVLPAETQILAAQGWESLFPDPRPAT